jgi:hypothetical protein|tara:strand:+ start:6773 stop:7135 length:363 start_codon:yes stop_codon:yes gene_type:complete
MKKSDIVITHEDTMIGRVYKINIPYSTMYLVHSPTGNCQIACLKYGHILLKSTQEDFDIILNSIRGKISKRQLLLDVDALFIPQLKKFKNLRKGTKIYIKKYINTGSNRQMVMVRIVFER